MGINFSVHLPTYLALVKKVGPMFPLICNFHPAIASPKGNELQESDLSLSNPGASLTSQYKFSINVEQTWSTFFVEL